MSKSSINIILVIASCVVLYYLANQLVSQKKVPPLSDFLASSTEAMSSSTDTFATSTVSTSTISSNKNLSTSTAAFLTLLKLPSTTIFAPKGSLKAFVADNDATREQGLSDISSLPQGNGELFEFDNPGSYGFWMKDMNFPLDIVWINKDKMITNITKNAKPDSYPSVFMPAQPILYVVEMNAGFADKLGLATGKFVSFSLPQN